VKAVFVDTLYWVAIVNPRDQWYESAKKARKKLGNVRLVTTDEVLVEFLTTYCRLGEQIRQMAVEVTRSILDDPNIKVFPQSRDSFLNGLALYADRKDKNYSLTDCVSMNVMKKESITDVLTNDIHFGQEGFNVLIS